MGNLYRVLRALEEDGLVTSRWESGEPGPAKRTYELTEEGRRLLDEWAGALRPFAQPHRRFLEALRREVNMHHGRRRHHRGFGQRWYDRENVLERLESYQRDLEQELADVSDLIERLKPSGSQETQSV